MKLNKPLPATLLIVLISLNIIVSSCLHMQRTKRTKKIMSNHQARFRNSSKRIMKKIDEVLEKYEEYYKDKKKALYVFLGVLSEFSDKVEQFYKKLKSVFDQAEGLNSLKEKFDPCWESIKVIAKKFKHVERDAKLDDMKDFQSIKDLFSELRKRNEKERQKYCSERKDEIRGFFRDAMMEKYNGSGSLQRQGSGSLQRQKSSDILNPYEYGHLQKQPSIIQRQETTNWSDPLEIESALSVEKNEEVCSAPLSPKNPKTREKLLKAYGNRLGFDYYEQCLYIRVSNCENELIEPSGAWSFIKKTYFLMKDIYEGERCILGFLGGLDLPGLTFPEFDEKNVIAFLNQDNWVASSLKTALNAVANTLTGGLWGGAKGYYHLVRLAVDIYNYSLTDNEESAFRLGKILGKAILVVKNIVFGGRRKK